MGGEKLPMQIKLPSLMGSPPRGRGKGMCRIFFRCRKRITPAWAGKRSMHIPARKPGRDHPRVGGEKCFVILGKPEPLGSPPRGRGKGPSFSGILHPGGITPAWAGKSHSGMFGLPFHRDHPRVGGEKPARYSALCPRRGSPPRGRGKATFSGRSDPGVRITPAWAGKRTPPSLQPMCRKDHPRVGGEKMSTVSIAAWNSGSPPRGRGKADL